LKLLELEGRDVPSVYWVTNGNDSGSGSLRAAYADAISNGNQAEIIIEDAVTAITLNSELITGTINLTSLEIKTENRHAVIISPSTDNAYRFIHHTGNNGVFIYLIDLTITEFGAQVVTSGGITLDYGHGGAIKTPAPLILDNCDFTENTAEGNGGAIYTEYSIEMEDCYFYFNVAEDDGGAIYSDPEETDAGITITDSVFTLNIAGNDGGAIFFTTVTGLLGIYGDATLFNYNGASSGHGGAIYQYGGGIEAISSPYAPAYGSGFQYDDDFGYANELYLLELDTAHIDIVVNGSGTVIYLYSSIPPSTNSYWCDINLSRVTGSVNTNWPV
jgi:predicted outer membrane repeat protein